MSASAGYQAVLRKQMAHDLSWATGGTRHSGIVIALIAKHNVRSVLDFGCGRGTLGNTVMGRDIKKPRTDVEWRDYDPAIPGKDVLKLEHVDMIVSTHSLEHIEPERFDDTLNEWAVMTPRVIYAAIPSGPATKTFAGTGLDLHLIQKPPWWWRKRLEMFGAVELLPPAYTRAGKRRDESRFVVVA